MADRHRGLTPAIARNYLEAASVCFDRHHPSPAKFSIRKGDESTDALAHWNAITERTRNAWRNESDATRDGAYACALAAVELTQNLVAVRRAETLTGADYYVGDPNQSRLDLEDCFRLEVSGIDEGNEAAITRRLRSKIEQVAAGNGNLPAMACVVGFRLGRIVLETVEAA